MVVAFIFVNKKNNKPMAYFLKFNLKSKEMKKINYYLSCRNLNWQLGKMVHTYKPSRRETEEEGSEIQDELGLHSSLKYLASLCFKKAKR